MSLLFKFLLISHVFSGMLGIILFSAVLFVLIKKLDSKRIKFLRLTSLWGLIGFLLSWITGGYYYVYYYGALVKPIIKAGPYPWAHSILMEVKEHVFLFLPFAALIMVLVVYLFGEDFENQPKIKNAGIWLATTIVFIGTAITLMGMAISGAVVK
ncbi:MAG: hypothetical protein AAB596_01840 [Patescibacteria group bacterium]